MDGPSPGFVSSFVLGLLLVIAVVFGAASYGAHELSDVVDLAAGGSIGTDDVTSRGLADAVGGLLWGLYLLALSGVWFGIYLLVGLYTRVWPLRTGWWLRATSAVELIGAAVSLAAFVLFGINGGTSYALVALLSLTAAGAVRLSRGGHRVERVAGAGDRPSIDGSATRRHGVRVVRFGVYLAVAFPAPGGVDAGVVLVGDGFRAGALVPVLIGLAAAGYLLHRVRRRLTRSGWPAIPAAG